MLVALKTHVWRVAPAAGAALLAFALLLPPPAAGPSGAFVGVAVLALVGAVLAAVHHAEVIAHRVGEPFGTLVLALAVTVIEAALILSLMLAGGPDKAALPRDTMFATVMIIANGVVGACLLVGGLTHGEQRFNVEGIGPALAAMVTMATLALVFPVVTTSAPSGRYTEAQMTFVAVGSAVLWLAFVFFQTIRHRGYFLVEAPPGVKSAAQPTTRQAVESVVWLMVSLVAVVGLAKVLSPTIEAAVAAAGAPKAVVGIAIAMLVLAPETAAAVRAARLNRLQTSMNLALGSALASIGLTVPVIVVAAVIFDLPLQLGLDAKDMVLFALTVVVSTITLGSGRTNLMQGVVHLVLFSAFLFLAFVP